ncbi:uncharacterized protein N7479_001509 [Penicillium vulpinum]|nr:uncharacterized protein N7479_001509 [Penicillium vulpinum]KAJ5971591.1 hypothetical protein N7479_001509 [Penicillium vulpinum]
MGQLSISDDCFRAQLRANIEASEQILETLGCINDQSRIDTPDLAGSRQPDTSNLFERGRPRRPSTFTHRQRDGQSFSGPYSTMGNDQNYPDSPPTDPQDSIITMLVISIYLRLLHNFDILVSIMYMRLTEFGPTTRNSQSSTSGLEVPKNEPGPSYNPALHVSMGNCSFSSPSTASLQVLFNVQLINTFLAKVKISIQRMVSRQKISEAFGMGHDLFNSAFSNGHQHSASSAGVPGLHYHYHGIRHETPPSSSHGAPRPDEGVFAAGIYRAVRGVLGEIDHMESSLQGRADSIQQWTIEKT